MKRFFELLVAFLILYVGVFCIASGILAACKVFGVI